MPAADWIFAIFALAIILDLLVHLSSKVGDAYHARRTRNEWIDQWIEDSQ